MPPITAWKRVVIENYAEYQGRAARPEYWWFVLANVVVYVAVLILIALIGTVAGLAIWFVYALAILVPSVCVAIRRLHDSDKSGWVLLLGFIPFVGGIILLVLMVLPGTPGPNKFGPEADPLPSS